MPEEFIHEGYFDSKGNEIPSVTQLLHFIGSDALVQWANRLGLRNISLDKYRDEVTLAGSVTHDRIAKYFANEPLGDEYYGAKVENVAEIAFARFKIWCDEAKVKPIWSEKRFSNDKYGGTIDLLCTVRDGITMLVDFKTSKKVKPTHVLQLAGYLNLIKDIDPDMYKEIKFVQVVALGGKETHLLTKPIEDMEMYQNAFEKVYMMYKAFKTCIEADKWEI